MTGATAREALPASGWSTRFDRRAGETSAVFRTADGAQLALVCDSAGPRPGRGRIEALFLFSQAPVAFPANVQLELKGGGQSLPAWAASLIVPVLQPKSGRNAPAAAAIWAAIQLDGGAADADLMRRFVALLQQGRPDLTLRVLSHEASIAIKGTVPARILKGFEQGCQNFLPYPDSEVIWDWHQGLALRDERRSVTLVAQAHAGQGESARITLHCHQNKLTISISGWPAVNGKQRLHLAGGSGAGAFMLERDESHSAAIAAHAIKPFLAALREKEILTLATDPDGADKIAFPVAGFSLASRLMAEECPAQMP